MQSATTGEPVSRATYYRHKQDAKRIDALNSMLFSSQSDKSDVLEEGSEDGDHSIFNNFVGQFTPNNSEMDIADDYNNSYDDLEDEYLEENVEMEIDDESDISEEVFEEENKRDILFDIEELSLWKEFFQEHYEKRHKIQPDLSAAFWSKPVVPNSSITTLWLCLYLLSLKIKHRVSAETINTVLQVLSLFSQVPKSYKTFIAHMKDFGLEPYELTACACCKQYVWPPGKLVQNCPICGQDEKEIIDYLPYTSYLALQFSSSIEFCNQIELFQEEIIKLNPEECVDWYSGTYGQKLLQKFDYKCTIFASLGFDGMNKSKSSTQDSYPVLVKTMSLSKKIRNNPQNLYMASMITYTKKPKKIDSALIPILHEFRYLHKNDFAVFNKKRDQVYRYNLCLVNTSCDLAAWFLFLGREQWSAKNACFLGNCIAQSVPNGVNKHGQSITKLSWDISAGEELTHDDICNHGSRGSENHPYQGMKQMPIITLVSYVDIVESYTMDIMHTFFVKGVFNTMLKGTYASDVYIKKQVETYSRKLKIQASHDHKRKYRGLQEINHMKAEEQLTHSLHYIVPIMCNISESKKWLKDLWSDYAELVQLLCLSEYDQDDKEKMTKLCESIPKNIGKRFTSKIVTFKIHSLRHIPKIIERMGPLKHYWCFPIENFLSYVRAIISGRDVVDKSLGLSCRIYSVLEALEGQNNSSLCNPTTMIWTQDSKKFTPCLDHLNNKQQLLGKPMLKKEISRDLLEHFRQKEVEVFKRANINGVVLHSTLYTRPIKRQSTHVEISFPEERDENIIYGVPAGSRIGVLTGFYKYDSKGYASVQLYTDIGIHNIGKYRMVSIELEPKQIFIGLHQIQRKGAILEITLPESYCVKEGKSKKSREMETPYKIFLSS
jgi:hypothetical protein